MKIDVSTRETVGVRCPFCLDGVASGPACPRCGARYHDECAAIVGRCGVLACAGALPVSTATGRAMPRLRAIALRLFRGRAPFQGEADRPGVAWTGLREAVVVLLPTPGAVTGTVGPALVGRLIGQTALDGRLRLSSPVPEPLLRVADLGEAARVVAQLREAGLDGIALPLEDLVRPLEHAVASEIAPGAGPAGGVVLRAEGGQPLAVPQPATRLVVATQLVEVTKRVERKAPPLDAQGRARSSQGRSTRTFEQKQYDPAALLFAREVAPPILVRLSRLRLDETVYLGGGPAGLAAATRVVRWGGLLERLCAGATHWTLAGSTNPMLLTPGQSALAQGADELQENLPCVLLAARLLHRAWLEGRSRPTPASGPVP